ncbi:MAG: hypothetical protein PPP56_08045 [Longimonas sp.]|uniref:hypothetical protein n=1 Tax=Longimonas sp. TaxID=2039626 RepID=UPI003344BB59
MTSWIQRLIQVVLGALGLWLFTRWMPRRLGAWVKRLVPLLLTDILINTLTIWLRGQRTSASKPTTSSES